MTSAGTPCGEPRRDALAERWRIFNEEAEKFLPTAFDRLREEIGAGIAQAAAQGAIIAKVLEGFDKGVFVRDVSHDGESGWAIRALPYLAALGKLAELPPSRTP